MRFHHSTRRRRHNRQTTPFTESCPSSRISGSSRLAQLSFCRDTNLYFNRRILIEPPNELLGSTRTTEEHDLLLTNDCQLSDQIRHLSLAEKPESEPQPVDLEFAREKLLEQVQKHPFWSKKAARKMHLQTIAKRQVFVYKLSSFCERRQLEWRFEPYRGGLVHSSGALLTRRPNSSCQSTNSSNNSPIKSPIARAMSSDSRLQSPAGSPARATSPRQDELQQPSTCGSVLRPLPAPDEVWALEVPNQFRPAWFTSQLHTSELPGSSFVKRCHGCFGRGKLKCNTCHGVGYEHCFACSGRGTERHLTRSRLPDDWRHNSDSSTSNHNNNPAFFESIGSTSRSDEASNSANQSYGPTNNSSSAYSTESCHFCHGAGHKRCWVCSGQCYTHCAGCLGAGQLRCFLQLTVAWQIHNDEQFLNNSDAIIPRERLRLCQGQLLADRISDSLKPLLLEDRLNQKAADLSVTENNQVQKPRDRLDQTADNLIQQVEQTSRKLIERHQQTFKQEKLIKQRHKLLQINCHLIGFEWKRRKGQFVIYGNERKLYISKYPFKSICNIT